MNKMLMHLSFGLMFLLCMSLQARAVDYELPDLNGQLQSLDQYKGKWLVVNYWATWCSTCMEELPDLISLHKDGKAENIEVVGVNFETISVDKLKSFVAKHEIPYTVLHTKPARETPLGLVPALPTTYIIDPNGKTVAGEVGIVSQKNLEDYIETKKASPEYKEF